MNYKGDMKEDILKELINIYVGQAASLLSEIVDNKIELRVPVIKILDNEYGLESGEYPHLLKGALMVSSMRFENELKGRAELIFPANHIKELISICMGEEIEEVHELAEFTDADLDIIKEIGNIVLNAVIGGLGNFLQMKIDYSMPEVKIFDNIEVEELWGSRKKMNMLILFVTFKIGGTEIDGALIINFTLDSMKELMSKVEEIESNL